MLLVLPTQFIYIYFFFYIKVCLVFVDKNTRDIILETELDVSQTRFDFVEGQVERGKERNAVLINVWFILRY